jgi:tetratricopeptide (TPR) repeat protein
MISRIRFVPVFAVAALLVALIATGCGDDGQSPGGDAAALVSEGWGFFVAGDYQSAVGKFRQATVSEPDYRDAYDGLGWAYARLGQLDNAATQQIDSATEAFLYALEILVKPSRDTYAGAAVVALALKDYERAALNANWAIERFEEEYQFRYDHDVTHVTLRLMRATARFHLGEYESAYADIVVLDDILGLGLPALSPGASNFVARLLSQMHTVRDAAGAGLI